VTLPASAIASATAIENGRMCLLTFGCQSGVNGSDRIRLPQKVSMSVGMATR
jgi:hypothetical protein